MQPRDQLGVSDLLEIKRNIIIPFDVHVPEFLSGRKNQLCWRICNRLAQIIGVIYNQNIVFLANDELFHAGRAKLGTDPFYLDTQLFRRLHL